jgi:alpha-1,3-rhamnosyltransferase
MESGQPLVSIILPSYNHEKYVEEAVLSIVRQTYRNFELFVVDDGSKDGSPQLLQRLSETYGFQLFLQKNSGVLNVLNGAIPRCKGKYIAFLSSDDYWVLDKLEKQVKYLEEHSEVGAVFGNALAINASGEILPNYFQRFYNYTEYSFYDVVTLKAQFPAPSNMFRKETFDKVGLYDTNYPLEDLYMNLKISYNKYKIGFLPDLLTFYRVHPQNISKRSRYMYEQKLKTLAIYKGEEGYKKGVLKTRLHYYMHVLLSLVPKALFPYKRS